MEKDAVVFCEWETIEFPLAMRQLGFQDYSYHNDACARALLPLQGWTEENGYPCIVCWTEHEAREDREWPTWDRFNCGAFLTEDAGQSETFDALLYQGESLDTCLLNVRAFLLDPAAGTAEGVAKRLKKMEEREGSIAAKRLALDLLKSEDRTVRETARNYLLEVF